MSCIFNMMGLVALIIYIVWVFYIPSDLMPMRAVFFSGVIVGLFGAIWICIKFIVYNEYIDRKDDE